MWNGNLAAALLTDCNDTRRRMNVLKGFHYPLTRKGKSTLNPPSPWYYSSDFLNIEFWADPAALVAMLPTGLDPDASADGHAKRDLLRLAVLGFKFSVYLC
jgi:hypothetical protein